jgi:hypothetical protein
MTLALNVFFEGDVGPNLRVHLLLGFSPIKMTEEEAKARP